MSQVSLNILEESLKYGSCKRGYISFSWSLGSCGFWLYNPFNHGIGVKEFTFGEAVQDEIYHEIVGDQLS